MLTRNTLQALTAALAGIAALAPIQPAAAQEKPVFVYGEPQNVRVEYVRFADLDLKANAGARKLERRVGAAVERVCQFDEGLRLQPNDYFGCASESWAKAQPQIDRAVARAQALAMGDKSADIATAIAISVR